MSSIARKRLRGRERVDKPPGRGNPSHASREELEASSWPTMPETGRKAEHTGSWVLESRAPATTAAIVAADYVRDLPDFRRKQRRQQWH